MYDIIFINVGKNNAKNFNLRAEDPDNDDDEAISKSCGKSSYIFYILRRVGRCLLIDFKVMLRR